MTYGGFRMPSHQPDMVFLLFTKAGSVILGPLLPKILNLLMFVRQQAS